MNTISPEHAERLNGVQISDALGPLATKSFELAQTVVQTVDRLQETHLSTAGAVMIGVATVAVLPTVGLAVQQFKHRNDPLEYHP